MRRHVIAVALALCAAVTAASSQDDRLATILAEAKAELAREKARIAAERGALEAERDTLVRQRDTLSDRRVDLRVALESQRRAADLGALAEKRETLAAELDRIEADAAEVGRIRADVARRLRDFVDAMPGRDREAPVAADADVPALLDAMRQILARGRGVSLTRETIVGPAGKPIDAEVMRIGQVGWAYRADGRVALSLKSPGSDEDGRWVEALEPDDAAALSAAFDAVAAGGATTAVVPIDPTQQLRSEARTRRETFFDVVKAGGPVMVPLAGVALLALLLILARVGWFAIEGRGAARLAERTIRFAESGDHDQAIAACSNARGPTARALAACLASRDAGVEAREDAIQEQILHDMPRVERFLSTIGILAAVAPLLGLLGTVTGMILTFEMIATFGSGDPRMMAGGISQALITTAAGLIIAIPILLAHAFLSARADRLIADTERFSATMLNVLRERS